MKYILCILRKEYGSEERYTESFEYEAITDNDTVATALLSLNEQNDLRNIEGEPSRKIEWECSCLQKKCGACAMVVNGRPALACSVRLAELQKKESPGRALIRLEPLRKFPCVCDLVADRSILHENLKTMKLWLENDSRLSEYYQPLAYEASECLQCGCCLEVCPNFYAGGDFFGMASVPVTTRLLSELEPSEYKQIARLYARHTFEGCGKSLACRDICPKKIDIDNLLVNANALALWKRKHR